MKKNLVHIAITSLLSLFTLTQFGCAAEKFDIEREIQEQEDWPIPQIRKKHDELWAIEAILNALQTLQDKTKTLDNAIPTDKDASAAVEKVIQDISSKMEKRNPGHDKCFIENDAFKALYAVARTIDPKQKIQDLIELLSHKKKEIEENIQQLVKEGIDNFDQLAQEIQENLKSIIVSNNWQSLQNSYF